MSPPGLSKEQTAYDDGPLYHPDLSPLLLLFLTAKNQRYYSKLHVRSRESSPSGTVILIISCSAWWDIVFFRVL